MQKKLSTHHLLPLDGLRGLAVLLVLLFHLGGGMKSAWLPVRAVGLLSMTGWTGVTLFFVLSGFLITGILWDSRGTVHWWRNFYVRRALRILPLYYASLLFVLVAAGFAGTFHQALGKIWSPVLFLQDIPGPDASVNTPGAPVGLFHFWSLAVEEQFYLLWPFLIGRMKSRSQVMRLCGGVFVFSELFRLVMCLSSTVGYRFTPFLFTHAGEMAAGGWLAMAYREELWARLKRPARYAAVIGFAVYACVAVVTKTAKLAGPGQLLLGLPAVTVGYGALLILSLEGGVVQKVLSVAWLRWVGSISYGIYVFHILFIVGFDALAQRLGGYVGVPYPLLRACIAVVGSVAAAWVSYHFFEAPILRLRRYFLAEKSTAAGRHEAA